MTSSSASGKAGERVLFNTRAHGSFDMLKVAIPCLSVFTLVGADDYSRLDGPTVRGHLD